jgi:hypothetical protein
MRLFVRRNTGLGFMVAIVVAACSGGLRTTGPDARDATLANPDEGTAAGDVGHDAVATNGESGGSVEKPEAASAMRDVEFSSVDGHEIGTQTNRQDGALDTSTGTDGCSNVAEGDACVEGDVPCPPHGCLDCASWKCSGGRWVLHMDCLWICP